MILIKLYKIIKNGIELDTITVRDFISKIRDKSIIPNYGWGSQIIIPYNDPVDGKEYELPFNFGTYQEFELEDGTKSMGFGLVAEYGVPVGGIQFDAEELSNPEEDRNERGNNRYLYSNIRQWLNKSGKKWYEPQHEYDAPPNNPSDNINGLLDCLPKDFIDACVPIKNVTKACDYDNNAIDIIYDKFFIPSLSQINCKCNIKSFGLNNELEGRYWEYWRNKTHSSQYLTTDLPKHKIKLNNDRIVHDIENYINTSYCWLRSVCFDRTWSVWNIYPWGNANHNCAFYRSGRCNISCVIM